VNITQYPITQYQYRSNLVHTHIVLERYWHGYWRYLPVLGPIDTE